MIDGYMMTNNEGKNVRGKNFYGKVLGKEEINGFVVH